MPIKAFLALYEPRGVRLPLLEALVDRAPYGQRPYRLTLCSRLALQEGELAGAERHYRDAIARWHGLGNYSMEGCLMRELVDVRALQGDYSELEELIARGLALVRQVGDRPGRPVLLNVKGDLLCEQGQFAAALPLATAVQPSDDGFVVQPRGCLERVQNPPLFSPGSLATGALLDSQHFQTFFQVQLLSWSCCPLGGVFI